MVFHDNLGGPEPFIAIDNTAEGSGRKVTFTPATEHGGVYQVSDFTTAPWTVGLIGAGATNSTNGFMVVCTSSTQIAATKDGPAASSGVVPIRMRRSGTGAVSKGAELYCTEGSEWVTPVSGAHTSTSGRLVAVLWEDVPAGGSDGDYLLVDAVFRGAPPHVA